MQHLPAMNQQRAPNDCAGALDDDLLAALDDVLSFEDATNIGDAFLDNGGATFGDELDVVTKVLPDQPPSKATSSLPPRSNKDVRAAAAAPYKKPSKPRRRKRPKHELDYLRAKVADMEKELAALKKKPEVSSPAAVSAAIIYGGDSTERLADGDQDVFLHWKKIAERQKEAVNRSVVENLKLRATLESQLNIARALEAAIDQQQREAAQSIPWQGGSTHQQPTTMSDELIYALLNDSLEAQYLELDAVLELSGLSDVHHDLKNGVKAHYDSGRVSFTCNTARLLPFSMRTVHRAMWSILRYGTAKDMMLGPFQTRVVDKNHMNVTMLEKVSLGESRHVNIVRRFAMRRFFEKDRVGVIWAAHVEINGSVFVRLREKGYTTTSSFSFGRGSGDQSDGNGVHGSITRMAILMTPELTSFESEQQEKEHIGEMTELVIATHQLSMDLVYRMVDTLLLRETMGTIMPGGEEEEDV